MSMTIVTEKFLDEEYKEEEEFLDDDNLSKSVADLSLSLETRILALNRFYAKYGVDETLELIMKLCTMYESSGIRLLKEYLFAICETSQIDPFLQSITAKSLHTHNTGDIKGYQAIDLVYPRLENCSTPYKIDFVKILMQNENFRESARNHFCKTVDDLKISCEYRFKIILKLEESLKFFKIQGFLIFLKNNLNEILYRILAGQNLLAIRDFEEKNLVEEILLSFSQNESVDYNLRADATDVLLQFGSENTKRIAKDIILTLGKMKGVVRTLYDNAQNVHTKEIEESVSDALEFLHSFEIERNIDGPYVEAEILKLENNENVKISLNRIFMDRVLYGKYHCNLEHILLRVWTYINGHKNEIDMKQRLIEELNEMAGTCSSGFVSRLINVLSGFGDFTMRISWADQVVGNLSGRLNARIRDLDNLTLQEKVLNQMTLDTSRYSERKHFLKFFRNNILSIREEMYEEFKTLISDTDFDLYFRTAISAYETS